MFLINANVLDDKFCLRKADIEIEDGKIVRLEDSLPYKEEDLVVDCAGYTIVPALWTFTCTAARVQIPATATQRVCAIWRSFC